MDGWAAEQNFCIARAARQTVVLRGYTRACRKLPLVAEESGRCLEVAAEVGEELAEDGVFALVDSTFIDLEVAANQAAAKRLLNQAEYWQRELRRFVKLKGGQAVSEAKVDELQQHYDQAHLGLAELEAQREILKERKRRCRIPAPAGWHLIERRVEPGQWLVPGQVVGLAGDYRHLLVPFSLTVEQYRRLLQIAAAGELSLFLPDFIAPEVMAEPVAALIYRQSPAFAPQTRKFELELEISLPPAAARGGIAAELKLDLPLPGRVVEVPAAALNERYDTFWLRRPDGSEVEVVKVGEAGDGFIQVVGEKVKAGDRFLLR